MLVGPQITQGLAVRNYYFDIWTDDSVAIDEGGMRFKSFRAAEQEAERTLASLASRAEQDRPLNEYVRRLMIEVRDANGRVTQVFHGMPTRH
jgi:hypothetical protein